MPPPLLLVADDDPAIRDILAQELRAAGYGVITAPDGATALVRFHESPPDVVLTDVAMPGVDGSASSPRCGRNRRHRSWCCQCAAASRTKYARSTSARTTT
jgi:CheY-like chemotaxis protein